MAYIVSVSVFVDLDLLFSIKAINIEKKKRLWYNAINFGLERWLEYFRFLARTIKALYLQNRKEMIF